MSDMDLENAFYQVSFKMYCFQTETFSASRISSKANTAYCENCGSEIAINRVPVDCYLCWKCFALNFVNINEAFLGEETIIDLFDEFPRIAIVGSFQFLYALTRLRSKSQHSKRKLLIACNEILFNRFSAYLPQAAFLTIDDNLQCDIDAVLLAGLHAPEEMMTRFVEAGVNKNRIFNVTTPQFKELHRNQLKNPYYYFEHTFAADLQAFGQIVGRYLMETIGEDADLILPATDRYAETINSGIKEIFPSAYDVGDLGWPNFKEFTHAIVTTNRLDDTQNLREEISSRYRLSNACILSLKETIYDGVWENMFC